MHNHIFQIYVKEAEKLASRKEFKGNIPLVETSAHETVNVETAFLTVAQLVERNRGRVSFVKIGLHVLDLSKLR